MALATILDPDSRSWRETTLVVGGSVARKSALHNVHTKIVRRTLAKWWPTVKVINTLRSNHNHISSAPYWTDVIVSL